MAQTTQLLPAARGTPSNIASQGTPQTRYANQRAIGQGTFGTVLQAVDIETNERVAIKRVMQDPRFKNRELQIMKLVTHPNIIGLRDYYYTNGDRKPDEVFLNVVMEFIPETLHRCCRDYYKQRQHVPMTTVRVMVFQLLRSIFYLQLPCINVCHRDIKPHNLLIDQTKGILKLCDFGSAKQLSPTEPNVAYICSRYYRAPELIFGCQYYTPAIDNWSCGCILAEMLIGEPLFRGDNSMNQLIEIIKVLGTPNKEQLDALSSHRSKSQPELRLPQVKPRPWSKVFREHVPPEAIDLASRLLQYIPKQRIAACEALCHPFFDELFLPTTTLPSGKPLPPTLFSFCAEEQAVMTAAQRSKLLGKVNR